MDSNPIYKFMKENNLTDMDEVSFVKAYSTPQKSAQIHQFMVENKLTDLDAGSFYSAYFDPSKKKGGTTQGSGQPVQQPTKPSAPSTAQSAFDAWNPAFKKAEPETEVEVQRESKFAPKQLDGAYDTWRKSITKEAKDYGLQIGYEKSPEEDEISTLRKAASDQLGKKSYTPEEQEQIQEIEDRIKKGEKVEMLKPEMGVGTGWRLGEFSLNNDPNDVSNFYQKASELGLDEDSSNILNLTNKKAEGSFYGESTMASRSYAEKAANLWFDLLSEKNPSKASYEREKYNKIKSTPENERSSDDEKFLRDTEGRAIELHAAGKSFRLNRVTERINDLNGRAVTDEQKVELDNLFEEYGKLDNSLMGMEKADKLNRMQYGYVRRTEAAEDEWEQDRYNKMSQGDGKLSQFFQSALGAMARGGIGIAQVPKVFGDLIGDKDYDYWDETYDSLEGTKRGISSFYNDLPQGKKSSDLPFTARLALVGGNAVGSASLFIGGGLLGGASRVGQTAATFGTAFLTSEADYYQEALDAGMDSQSAALFGTYLATQSAILESIIPDVKYLKTPEFRRSVRNSVMKRFNSGMPLKESMKFGYKDALKTLGESGLSYLKTGTKEAFIEELPTTFAEDLSKTAANAVGQKKYFNDTFDGDSYVDAILGSFVAGPAMNLLSRPDSKSPVQEEVIREIAERKDKLLKRGTASDKATEPDSKKEIEDTAEILNGMKAHSGWNNMSREEQNHALATAQQVEVIKKEQEMMKKIGIEDEAKNEQIKQLENEVNEMFSIQLDRQKQSAYDAKLKAIEGEFSKSMEGEEFPVQEDERDQEIVELQKQREERGVNEVDTLFSDMKPMVPFAVERIEQGQPVAQSVKQAASNYLYKKYKELTDMKSNPNRMMTRQQIANVQKQLEQDIRTLEGTAEVKPQVDDQENIQGVPSEVGKGQEPVTTQPIELTSEEAPATGGVLQAQEEVAGEVEVKVSSNQKSGVGNALQEGEKRYDIIKNGVVEGDIIVADKKELGHYEIVSSNVKNQNKGIGTEAYKKLIATLDKPLHSDMARTGQAEKVWKKLEAAGLAKKSKDGIVYESLPTQVIKEPAPKPARKTRLAKLFETPEGETAAGKVADFLKESNIGVEVLDTKAFEETGKQRNFEGGADGVFLVDNNTGKIYLNQEKIKTAEGKTIAFHEGIHPVVNIIRNTNPKQYQAIVQGLKAEAARNNAVAEAAAAVAASEYYQEQGPLAIEDETLVETMARVAAGDIDIDTFEPTFREKFIDFMNKLAKMLGLNPIAVNSPRVEVKRLADQLSKALNEGGKISDIVGKKNVKEFQSTEAAQKRAVSIAKGKESLLKYGLKKGVNTTRKIGEALEKRSRELYGIIARDDRSEKALKAISSFMADEVRFFVEEFGENSGKGWYGEKFQKGLDAMAAVFPEMKDDQNARDLFTMLVAITSDGTEVMQNFQQASLAYKNYKETGKMPTTAKAQRAESYMVNFRNIQELLDKYNGDIQAIKKELLTVGSISDLNQQRKAQGLDKLDTQWPASFKVPLAASIFGPKLGMFYANLSGMEQYPTLDRWWSRTFNRYRGTLIPQITRGYNKKGEALGIDRYREIAGLKDASEEEVLAKIVQDHDTYEDRGYKKGTPAEKAANTLYKKLYVELNDAPFGAKDRQFMYDAFIETQKKLKRSGVNVTIADIQAILWYFEKNLYKKLGVTKPIQGISYEDAANKTFEKWKNAGNSFNYAIKESEQGETIDEVDIDEESKPTVQPSKGILRGKRPTKADVDKYLSEQEFFRNTSPFAWAVDAVSEETLKKSRIVENEGTYGVVTEDGDIKGVFNPNAAKQREGVPAKKNTLAGLIPKAINAGGIKLDNFDGRLTELYSKNGFRKVSSVPFNEEYAPEGWSKEKDGTPDVVSMVYDPDNKLDIEFKKFDDYGDMISYRDSFVDQARKEVDKKWGEKKVITLTKRDELGTKTDREIAAYASKFLNKFGPYTKANVIQIMNMSAEEKIKLINDTFEAKFKKRKPEPGDPEDYFYEQGVKRRDQVLALVTKPTVQPSVVKRTPAQIRQAVEDGVDAVEAAIAEGMDPQQAVDENVSSQDWYGDLSAAQKEQLNEILQDEFGATASEPKAATPVGEQIASIVDNYYKLKDGDRSARAAINEILGSDPKLKYIYDNISKINKQLQDAGVITDKTDGCP
jgi:hypothetical protein